jgi:hypothetical protein
LHDFGFFKIDGDIIYQNKPVGIQDMERYTSTNKPDSEVNLFQKAGDDIEEI